MLGVVLDEFGMGHTSARENRCKNDPMDLVCPLVIMFISFTNGFPLSLGRKRLVVASTWTSLLGCPETYQAASLPRQPDDRVGSVWFGVLMRNAQRGRSAKYPKTNGDPGAIRTRVRSHEEAVASSCSTRCRLFADSSPPASEAVPGILKPTGVTSLFGKLGSVR